VNPSFDSIYGGSAKTISMEFSGIERNTSRQSLLKITAVSDLKKGVNFSRE
jgi:hypothetical protein